jgi:transposase InsO family protein
MFGKRKKLVIGDVLAIQENTKASADREDWRRVLTEYIKNPSCSRDHKIRWQALRYKLVDGVLHHRTMDGLLFRCLSEEEAGLAMGEVHGGLCGAHQSAHKMWWTLWRTRVYWPSLLRDCFKYYKGCEECQKFGKIEAVLASMLHPVIKPWPFRGWGLDFIGEIHPSSSKGHRFVLVATDYFSKWVETVHLRNMTHREGIDFVLQNIIYRFGVPQTLMKDQGASFISHQFKEFAASLRIKLMNSSPYYAQSNGQAEASNKIIISLIKKKTEEKPRRWHEVLTESLWAYRTSEHGTIQVTPFKLVYG